MLPNWLAQYKKNGILLLRKQEGDQLKWDVNGRKPGRNDRTRATQERMNAYGLRWPT